MGKEIRARSGSDIHRSSGEEAAPKKVYFSGQINNIIAEQQRTVRRQSAVQLMEKAFNMYQGNFLSADEDKPSAVSGRERLKNRLIHRVSDMGRRFEEKGDFPKKRKRSD